MSPHDSWLQIITLLSDIVVFNSYDFEQFLKKLIGLTARIVPVHSCLIYFYDRHRKKLILIASKKPHKQLMGKLSLKSGEGITGWVVEHKKTVVLHRRAYKDERFKYFKELPEDKYEAFLSVPIIDKEGVVGVMNLQHRDPYRFSQEQTQTIEAIVKIISSAFEKIICEREIDHLTNKLEERKRVEKAKGLLMKIKQIGEVQAYELMRTEAMKKRKSMIEIAEAVLLLFG